jgi:DNA (cytosine-5)-methyltransferase 1
MGHPNPIFAWRSKFSDFLYKADPSQPIRTLKASGGQYTGPFHWHDRHFTIEELKRLQTFPDNYKICGNKAVANKQIGNSVPPQFARILALSVLKQFFDVDLPFPLHFLEENEPLSFRNLKRQRTGQYLEAANRVLDNIKSVPNKKIRPQKFAVSLSQNFKILDLNTAPVQLEFKPTNSKWILKLNRTDKNCGELFQINITKGNGNPLFHSVTCVQLISTSNALTDYTILWKVLEQLLSSNNIKADLIQLNGYYQYRNDISFEFKQTSEAHLRDNTWKVIKMILNDRTIGEIKNIMEFKEMYNMDSDELLECFNALRDIGFEIRNTNTNPEIKKNHFLIPYKFPTLTPLSVQLKRSLI